MSKSLYFARQPILDIHGRTYAYELLYRSSSQQRITEMPDDRSATAHVLVNTLNLVGLENILGNALAFINVDQNLLMDEMIFSVPKEHFVLEILETVKINDALIARMLELKELGYRFALDDVDCSKEYILNFQPIFEYIDIVKIDITIVDEERLPRFLELFKKFNIKILAEKVETQDEFDRYKTFGCDYFQGFFFAKPDIIENKSLDPDQLIILHLIQQIQQNEEIDHICRNFEQNVALTLQLLRFINSAAFSFRTRIKSIRQAVMLLGPNQLKSWLLLISYAKPAQGSEGLENPLLHLAQTRSNLMQTFTQVIFKERCNANILDKAAFIGLLSLVDTLFQVPMKTILTDLNVDEEIVLTLVDYKGEFGQIFQLVCAVEQFETENIDRHLEHFDITKESFSVAIQTAYETTEQFIQTLKAS